MNRVNQVPKIQFDFQAIEIGISCEEMRIKQSFCNAIKTLMESTKSGKTITEIICDDRLNNLSRREKTGAENALLKLSEKVLLLKGQNHVILDEILNDLKEHDCQKELAFAKISDKVSIDCCEVISLVEVDDLKIPDDNDEIINRKVVEDPLLSLRVSDSLIDTNCQELEIMKEKRRKALPVQQEETHIQPKV